MKKTLSFMWLMASLFMFAFASCNKDDSTDFPESKGEKTVQEIAKALESKPEVSQFTEMLSKVELPDLNEDRLTVFAVKNPETSMRSRSAVLDSTSIKRHIAIGSYSKSKLTDGLVLKSVNGENLYISRSNDDVSVNGVEIEGEEMAVGNSYVFVVPEVFDSQTSPTVPGNPDNLEDIRYLWKNKLTEYADRSWLLEASLTTGYGGFNFNDINVLSDSYWNLSHSIIEDGEDYLSSIEDLENGKGLADTINVELAMVRTQLYAYYGKYISNNKVCSANDLENDCLVLMETLPSAASNAVSLLLSKVYLCNGKYDVAKNLCDKIINSGNYTLSENPYETSMRESLWRVYNEIIPTGDGGKSEMFPLLYREVILIKGLAEYATGNQNKLLESLNMINTAFGEQPIDIAGIDINKFIFYIRNTGGEYPYYRILTNMEYETFNYPNVEGFQNPKHLLLPIPESAFTQYPELTQNPGY